MKGIRLLIPVLLLFLMTGCGLMIRQTQSGLPSVAEESTIPGNTHSHETDSAGDFGTGTAAAAESPASETVSAAENPSSAEPVQYVYYHYVQMYDDMAFKISFEEGGNYSYYHEITLEEPLEQVDSPYAEEGYPTYGYFLCTQEEEGFSDQQSLWFRREGTPEGAPVLSETDVVSGSAYMVSFDPETGLAEFDFFEKLWGGEEAVNWLVEGEGYSLENARETVADFADSQYVVKNPDQQLTAIDLSSVSLVLVYLPDGWWNMSDDNGAVEHYEATLEDLRALYAENPELLFSPDHFTIEAENGRAVRIIQAYRP